MYAKLNQLQIGVVGVQPQIFFLETDATLSQIKTTGYFNIVLASSSFSASVGDVVVIKYLNQTQSAWFLLSQSGNEFILTPTGTGNGTITGAANLGGVGLYAGTTGTILDFKGLLAGSNVNFTVGANTITINSSGGGSSFDYQDALWVAQNNGNDGNSGTSINTPLLLVQTAITDVAPGGSGSIIYVEDAFNNVENIVTSGTGQQIFMNAPGTNFNNSITVSSPDVFYPSNIPILGTLTVNSGAIVQGSINSLGTLNDNSQTALSSQSIGSYTGVGANSYVNSPITSSVGLSSASTLNIFGNLGSANIVGSSVLNILSALNTNIINDGTCSVTGIAGPNTYNVTNFLDNHGNNIVILNPATTPVNYIQLSNSATSNDVTVSALGTDTDINLRLNGKGTGSININGAYTLPAADGTANYVMTTNGAGVVSWQPGGGGGSIPQTAVYVSQLVGSDITGAGTISNPYATIQNGLNNLNTFTQLVVLDNATYPENLTLPAIANLMITAGDATLAPTTGSLITASANITLYLTIASLNSSNGSPYNVYDDAGFNTVIYITAKSIPGTTGQISVSGTSSVFVTADYAYLAAINISSSSTINVNAANFEPSTPTVTGNGSFSYVNSTLGPGGNSYLFNTIYNGGGTSGINYFLSFNNLQLGFNGNPGNVSLSDGNSVSGQFILNGGNVNLNNNDVLLGPSTTFAQSTTFGLADPGVVTATILTSDSATDQQINTGSLTIASGDTLDLINGTGVQMTGGGSIQMDSGVIVCGGNINANADLIVANEAFFNYATGIEAANAVTVNAQTGIITTSSLTTTAGSTYSITLTNSFIATDSGILLTMGAGSNTTNGIQLSYASVANNSCIINITNNNPLIALTGTILISFMIFGQ